MKESYGEGVATHTDPESCVGLPRGGGEALTGAHAGRVLSREIYQLQGANAMPTAGRLGRMCRYRETHSDPARSKTPSTYGNTSHGNREIPQPPGEGVPGRIGKSEDASR